MKDILMICRLKSNLNANEHVQRCFNSNIAARRLIGKIKKLLEFLKI